MRTLSDIANAPTEVLIQAERQAHINATLGGNRIIRDYYRTQALSGQERVTRLLPRQTKRPRRVISAALKSIAILSDIILAIRKEFSK